MRQKLNILIFKKNSHPLYLQSSLNLYFLFLFVKILFIFRERGREGEREGEKHQCVVASRVAPMGTWSATQACDLTGN